MKYFRVKNWDSYQHYKDRSPPWIKLHREMLSSQTWVMLDDDKKALAVACMLLAAATDNKIPFDAAYVQRVAYLKSLPDFSQLLEFDFIEIIDEIPKVAITPLADASKPYSEKSREETEKRQNGHQSVVPTDVTLVFEHWKQVHEHPRSNLDAKREKLIRVALKTYPPEQLCLAISGYRNSPFHMGQNERNKKFDDIEVFLRDAKHIDEGLKFGEQPRAEKWT